jgi:hypothetical protein
MPWGLLYGAARPVKSPAARGLVSPGRLGPWATAVGDRRGRAHGVERCRAPHTRAKRARASTCVARLRFTENFDGPGAGFSSFTLPAPDLRPASLPPGRFSGNRKALQAAASRVLRGARDARK